MCLPSHKRTSPQLLTASPHQEIPAHRGHVEQVKVYGQGRAGPDGRSHRRSL